MIDGVSVGIFVMFLLLAGICLIQGNKKGAVLMLLVSVIPVFFFILRAAFGVPYR